MPGIIPKSVARAGLYQVCDNSILTRYRQGPGMGDVDDYGNEVSTWDDSWDGTWVPNTPPGVMTTSETCNVNTSYPAGHKCAITQQVVDANAVLRVVFPNGVPTVPPTAKPKPVGVDIAEWLSANSTLVAWGIAGVIGLKLLTARR